ncbi:hypothetical protein BJ684DRAFT_17428 [Piptocephalis cylindrospora]|uniref:Uncharacterized protein n=1 Tax=Piptocephalis cylindrospora TaxID=1907219 RepID=A0A4P9XZV9_9FUNG|nr:hypothetical protein BJ684DRAFT_17428 [Piptocephalis cylindrospora]|eukprot:RKP12046.1 hypothetical protein BJ684DRAFT_17428 [Piptocephalis cylindrospora]
MHYTYPLSLLPLFTLFTFLLSPSSQASPSGYPSLPSRKNIHHQSQNSDTYSPSASFDIKNCGNPYLRLGQEFSKALAQAKLELSESDKGSYKGRLVNQASRKNPKAAREWLDRTSMCFGNIMAYGITSKKTIPSAEMMDVLKPLMNNILIGYWVVESKVRPNPDTYSFIKSLEMKSYDDAPVKYSRSYDQNTIYGLDDLSHKVKPLPFPLNAYRGLIYASLYRRHQNEVNKFHDELKQAQSSGASKSGVILDLHLALRSASKELLGKDIFMKPEDGVGIENQCDTEVRTLLPILAMDLEHYYDAFLRLKFDVPAYLQVYQDNIQKMPALKHL